MTIYPAGPAKLLQVKKCVARTSNLRAPRGIRCADFSLSNVALQSNPGRNLKLPGITALSQGHVTRAELGAPFSIFVPTRSRIRIFEIF